MSLENKWLEISKVRPSPVGYPSMVSSEVISAVLSRSSSSI